MHIRKRCLGTPLTKKQYKIDHLLISTALLPAVIRSDFFPFGEILESDHRTGFVDFDSTVLFEEDIPDLTNKANRKLHTKHSKRITKYKEKVKKEFTRRNLFQSLGELLQKLKTTGLPIILLKKYNAIDKESIKTMLKV